MEPAWALARALWGALHLGSGGQRWTVRPPREPRFLKNQLDKKARPRLPTAASKAEFGLNVVIAILGTILGGVGGSLSLKKAGII